MDWYNDYPNYRITQLNKIQEVNNSYCHNYYYICYGKIYNKHHEYFKRFKFVFMYDIFDAQEYYEKDNISKKELRQLAIEYANWYLEDNLRNKDFEDLKDFYDFCNTTINNYNQIVCY